MWRERLFMVKTLVVNVPVATVWTTPDSPRNLDQKVISNPVYIQSWIDSLSYEESLELCNSNLVQTQVLFGEVLLVAEEKDGWSKVLLPEQGSNKDERGYPGWIPNAQLTVVEGWNVKTVPIAVVISKKTELFDENRAPQFLLSYQTILPVFDQDEKWVKVQTPTGVGFLKTGDVEIVSSFAERKKGNGHEIVKAGEQFLNLPYLWAGTSSFGYDCSGFSYSMCKANGYIIPRDAGDQAEAGKSIPLNEIEPGDLLFFAYEEGKGGVHHVGIYYGDGKLLHSPKTGKTIEIIELQGTIYEKELCAASRYW